MLSSLTILDVLISIFYIIVILFIARIYKPKGKEAFKRIMCYNGIPEQFEGKQLEKIPGAEINKVPNLNYVTIQEICKKLGVKQ